MHRLHGSAADLLQPPPSGAADPVAPAVWLLAVDRPTLVLGSTQPDTVLDRDRARARGVEVVRRRSGGGAVLLRPGTVTWLDVFVPAADRLWSDDVGRAFWWLGETWKLALDSLGVDGAEWHRGPLVRNRWSDLVCFAGLGPGEVVIKDGRKAVGMSQRRTRAGALVQCAALHAWDAVGIAELLELDSPEAARDLAGAAAGLPVDPGVLQAAFLAALATR